MSMTVTERYIAAGPACHSNPRLLYTTTIVYNNLVINLYHTIDKCSTAAIFLINCEKNFYENYDTNACCYISYFFDFLDCLLIIFFNSQFA